MSWNATDSGGDWNAGPADNGRDWNSAGGNAGSDDQWGVPVAEAKLDDDFGGYSGGGENENGADRDVGGAARGGCYNCGEEG